MMHMFGKSLEEKIVDAIGKKGPIKVKDLVEALGLRADEKEKVNS